MSDTPTHRRGTAVTEHLLASALDLVAERGSTAVTMEEIAERAEVNKTTAYRRWPDVHLLIRDAVIARAESAVPIEPSGDVRADLIELCSNIVANLESPIGRALTSARRDLPELIAMRQAFWHERLHAATELLGDRIPTSTGDLVMERLVGPLHFRINERALTITSDSIEQLVDHFLRGLLPEPSEGAP